jgi:hypothetical protein
MQNFEREAVIDMASRPSIGRLNNPTTNSQWKIVTPELRPNTHQTEELVAVIELDDVMKHPHKYSDTEIEEKHAELLGLINGHLANCRPVIVRGWHRDLPWSFTKTSIKRHFGDLGQRVEYFDGFRFAQNRNDSSLPYHIVDSLENFIDTTDNPNICGNWMDSKHLQPNPPSFLPPLLHSTTAWNMTFPIQFSRKPNAKTRQVMFNEPTVVRSANWSSPGWRLVTQPGCFTKPHNDCCGLATYVVAEAGHKKWAFQRPRKDRKVRSIHEELERCREAHEITPGAGYDCDMVIADLEQNDVM